jgi:hypothetical protein
MALLLPGHSLQSLRTAEAARGAPAPLSRIHLLEGHRMTLRSLRCWLPALGLAAAVALAGIRPASAGDKKGGGFTDLFDGKDMANFKWVLNIKGKNIEGDDPLMTPTRTWHIDKGVIICTGNPNGYFFTKKSYKNYVLRYDWKYKRPAKLEDDQKFGGNSGLLVHIEGAQKVWPKCVEVQGMNREHGKIFAIGGGQGKFSFDAEALKKARNPVGEWNTTEVTVNDGMITSKVNGAEIATGKTTNLTEGPFGLQSEGAEIHFKNIKIKVLP